MKALHFYSQIEEVETKLHNNSDDLVLFVDYACALPEHFDPLWERKRKKGLVHTRKNVLYHACLTLLYYVANAKGHLNDHSLFLLFQVSCAYDITPLDELAAQQYAKDLYGDKRKETLKAFSLLLACRSTPKGTQFYDDFVKGLWVLCYGDLPIDHRQFEAMLPFYREGTDEFPTSYQEWLNADYA
jgi:hypothetical protein